MVSYVGMLCEAAMRIATDSWDNMMEVFVVVVVVEQSDVAV